MKQKKIVPPPERNLKKIRSKNASEILQLGLTLKKNKASSFLMVGV